jgi:hypothetical protein
LSQLAALNAVDPGLDKKSPAGMLCKSGFTPCANLQLKVLASNSSALKAFPDVDIVPDSEALDPAPISDKYPRK